MDGHERPLSPFLTYRWQITNTLSILHRLTGIGLSVGLLVLVCWLAAVAAGPAAFAAVEAFYGGLVFGLALLAWAFCFFFHLGNGIRHLCWDIGWGFGHAQITAGGWSVVAFAVIATAVFAVAVVF